MLDALRSGYFTKMRFNVSDPEVDVRWFFTAKGAKAFPGPTFFGSWNWEDHDIPNSGLGEQIPGSRAWSDVPPPATLLGQSVTPFPEVLFFSTGIPDSFSSDTPLSLFGEPEPCAGPPFGLRFGGLGTQTGK